MGALDSSIYKLEAAEQIEKNILGAAVNFADIFEMTIYAKSSSSNKASYLVAMVAINMRSG